MSSVAEADWLAESSGATQDVRGFYSTIGFDLPGTGTENASVRCFARPDAHSRDDRTPSCSVSLISGAWICRGCGEKGNAYRAAQLAGYEDKRAAILARQYGLFLEVVKQDVPKLPGEGQVKKWNRVLRAERRILYRLCELKAWDPLTALMLGLGWDGERVTVPIRYCTPLSHQFKLCGLVRYSPKLEPKILAMPGTKRNLFPCPEWCRRGPLFLVEGEGTAVSLWSVGLPAVGIPGAGSWKREWAARFGSRRVVMLPDCDAPGRDLALRVRRDLPRVEVVELEADRMGGEDVGDWLRESAVEGGRGQVRRVLERLIT